MPQRYHQLLSLSPLVRDLRSQSPQLKPNHRSTLGRTDDPKDIPHLAYNRREGPRQVRDGDSIARMPRCPNISTCSVSYWKTSKLIKMMEAAGVGLSRPTENT